VHEIEPNLLFLDIELESAEQFHWLEALGSWCSPLTIFLSTSPHHAIEAFGRSAFDFLLKPLNLIRVRDSIARAKQQLAIGKQSFTPKDVREYSARIAVKTRDRFILLAVTDINFIKSAANYVELHTRAKTYMFRTTMNVMVGKLDPSNFARIHRSIIVNLAAISEIKPLETGDCEVRLTTGEVLGMSRKYRSKITRLF
jgi:two-component system LytT family response regulator